MSITALAPNTIHLHGETDHVENRYTAGVAITPGMLIELYNVSGSNKWRPQTAAAGISPRVVALNQVMENKGIDDVYAIGDLVQAWFMEPGDEFYGILLSGATAANGDYVQSDGTGKLKAATATTATANVAVYQSLDNVGTVGADTRIRTQVIA